MNRSRKKFKTNPINQSQLCKFVGSLISFWNFCGWQRTPWGAQEKFGRTWQDLCPKIHIISCSSLFLAIQESGGPRASCLMPQNLPKCFFFNISLMTRPLSENTLLFIRDFLTLAYPQCHSLLQGKVLTSSIQPQWSSQGHMSTWSS